MLDALSITEAEAAGLSELAALDLAMARDFAARAQAAEDPAVANDLARSYQRMARSYRQSLALKARLRMETIHADRETPRRTGIGAAAAPTDHNIEDDVAIDLRAEELHGAVERVIWTERERAEAPETEADDMLEQRFERLEARLDRLVRNPRFAREPLDDQVIALCRDIGLDEDLARRWRELPEPTIADPPDGSPDGPPPQRESG
jgi:hypothetical protein